MKRLYYLTDSLESVTQITGDLHQDGITDWHLHVLSRNEAGLYHRKVHSANVFQENDIIHLGEVGAMIGGAVGLVASTLIGWLQPFGFNPPFPFLLFQAGLFTLFGAWSGGLIGCTKENYKIARFHNDLDNGRHLIMVDVYKQQEKKIRHHLHQYHPEACLAGEDSTLTIPFFSPNFWHYPQHHS